MTLFVYPRLPYFDACQRIEEISATFQSGGIPALEGLATCSHAKADPVATGGRVADPDQIARVRQKALTAVEPWRDRGVVSRNESAVFDLAIGKSLHDVLQIVPSDAAHDGVWSFLTLVTFPDLAVLRFPDMHPDRMLGTNRNVLRRAWLRRDALGDLTDRYTRPLGEDEMVGLFERSAMARNRPLIRALASTVMEHEGKGARSDWARELYKVVRYLTGPRSLDGFTETDLRMLIHETVDSAFSQ